MFSLRTLHPNSLHTPQLFRFNHNPCLGMSLSCEAEPARNSRLDVLYIYTHIYISGQNVLKQLYIRQCSIEFSPPFVPLFRRLLASELQSWAPVFKWIIKWLTFSEKPRRSFNSMLKDSSVHQKHNMTKYNEHKNGFQSYCHQSQNKDANRKWTFHLCLQKILQQLWKHWSLTLSHLYSHLKNCVNFYLFELGQLAKSWIS